MSNINHFEFKDYRVFETTYAGRPLVVETGKMAQLANGSCLVRYGETAVLVTATASPKPRDGIDFFPLSGDFADRLYAVGRIPGSFMRREGRERPLMRKLLHGGIHIHAQHPCGGKECVQLLLHPLGSRTLIPLVLPAAQRARFVLWAHEAAVVAAQSAVGAVVGERHRAVRAPRRFGAGSALDKRVIPPAVEKQDGLLPSF